MEHFLNRDNPFFQFMSKIADVFILNLLWVLFSIPIITAGAATTAAFYEGMRLAKEDDGLVFKRFWKSFRQNFKQATIIHIIFLVIGVLLAFDMYMWLKLKGDIALIMLALTTIAWIIYIVMVLYTYATLARFENSILATIKNALLIAVANFPLTLLMLAILAVYAALNYLMILLNFLTFFIGMGLLAYVYGILFNIAFRKFIPLRDKKEKELRPILEDVELQPKYQLNDPVDASDDSSTKSSSSDM